MIQEMEVAPQKQKSATVSKIRIGAGVALLLALVVVGIVPRISRQREALAATKESPVTHPVVSVVHAQEGQPTSELLLPGNVQPQYSSAIYARTEGYLQKRLVDIGARVKAGQLLATISSPEVDQQLLEAHATLNQSLAALEQTKAALQQAKANEELARITKERYIPLGQQNAVSQQDVDAAVQAHGARIADVAAANANIGVAQANIAANQAKVARLQQLQEFQRVVAPFDGVVTERNVEQGDLVTTGGSGKPLFQIAQSGTMRIQVDVPQSQAVNIQNGQKASVTVQERLGRDYSGTVARSADALNDAARTMRAEVQVDNRDGSLLPGMYAQVKFTLPVQRTSLIIPTSSLVVDHSGTRVVVIQDSHRIHFAPVVIGRDMGTQVEILSGVDASAALVASPNDLLREGQDVRVQ